MSRRSLLAALLGCTLLKVLVAASFTGTVEVRQMRQQAEAALAGRDLLVPASTGNNPSFFLSGHYAIVTGAMLSSRASGLPFAFVVKLPAIAADLLIALLLLGARPRDPATGATTALAFMFNPVSFLLSAYHGQPHTVAVAGGVLALWLAERGRAMAAGVALALAASVRQHLALLAVPLALILPRQERPKLLAALAAVGVVLNAGIVLSAHPERVLAPTWVYGTWGYTMVLVQAPRLLARLGLEVPDAVAGGLQSALLRHGWLIFLGWAGAFALGCWRARDRGLDPWAAALVFFAGLCALSPGFGVQWTIWALPFWLVVHRRSALLYSALAGAFLAGSYWQWTLPARYGVESITANLHLLGRGELLAIALVGALGLATWALTAWAAWRFSGPLRGRP